MDKCWCNTLLDAISGMATCKFCVDAMKLQVSDLQKKLVAALCRCGSPEETSLSLHVPSCEYWKASEKRVVSPQISEEQRRKEPSNMCHKIVKYDGGSIYCYQPIPCRIHG